MAPPRRGRPPRAPGSFAAFGGPELRGTLGTLLRTTLAQAGAVRDALERGARQGRARLDDALADRRRTEAFAALGALVADKVRRGELAEVADDPDCAEHLAAIDDLEPGRDDGWEEAGGGRRARPEPGRDWVAPGARARFDRAAPGEPEDADGTVSSRDWIAPRGAAAQRVWRPPRDEEPAAPTAPPEAAAAPPPAAPGRPATRPAAAGPGSRGGIVFGTDDDDDLSAYMHPDDVPDRGDPHR